MSRFYLSTIDANAERLAREYGLGLELCQFCVASNMDADYAEYGAAAERSLAFADRFVFHAPFAELSPCAIDPLVRAVVKKRLKQAAELAERLGIDRMVVHSGYIPSIYFPEWFLEQSVIFWTDFMREIPQNMQILLENVMDESPNELKKIAERVGDERLRLCLDVGHANVCSKVPPLEWIREYGSLLGHLHLHNNNGLQDTHSPLGEGTVDICGILDSVRETQATVTLELTDSESSLKWLAERGYIWKKN